jgi:adenosylhomocysteine nucleosidase
MPAPAHPPWHLLRTLGLSLCLALTLLAARASPPLDEMPRMAVMSAFEPEWRLLLAQTTDTRSHRINGVEFVTGTLRGRPVVLFLSGISMTNAAMNTQLVLDRFRITHIVFSGIAGGVNPADVRLPNFGMLHPRPVETRSAAQPGITRKFWFDADPQMLAVARSLAPVKLDACDATGQCLSQPPRLVVGGQGVSGPAFVDNAALLQYTFRTFEASVLDMETAATAMVAYSNSVPFIAFRSLSDLAGGGEGANEMGTFMNIAADNSARVLLAFLDAWK